jgi:hypothetical protein
VYFTPQAVQLCMGPPFNLNAARSMWIDIRGMTARTFADDVARWMTPETTPNEGRSMATKKSRTYGYLKFEKRGDNLYISATREGKAEARELMDNRRGIIQNLSDMLEPALGNGWNWIPPEDIGALTDAPIISEDGFIADNGTWEVHPDVKRPRVYAHMNYAVEDPIETWAAGGTVRFDGAEVQYREPRHHPRKLR